MPGPEAEQLENGYGDEHRCRPRVLHWQLCWLRDALSYLRVCMPVSIGGQPYCMRDFIAIQSNKLIPLCSPPYLILATPQSMACMAMSFAVTIIIAFPVAVFDPINARHVALKERLPSIVVLRDARPLESAVHQGSVVVVV